MATRSDSDKIFQCSKCEKELQMDSMTLPCLHSLCGRCFEEEFLGRKYGNRHCPECQEFVIPSQLTLSPFLVHSLKHRQHYGSTEWKCEVCLEEADFCCKDCDQLFCLNFFSDQFISELPNEITHNLVPLCKKGDEEDEIFKEIEQECVRRDIKEIELKCDICFKKGVDSLAKISCKDCKESLCDDCNWYHNNYFTNHNSMELGSNEKVREIFSTEWCNEHEAVEEFYCERCNVCFCNTCYNTHLKESPQCPSHRISVWEEAVKKKTSQCPTLYKEIDKFKINLQKRNQLSQFYCEQLEMNCHKKCKEIWQNFEEIVEELRNKTIDLCDEVRFIKDEQVKKWRELMDENDRMLKKLDILFLHLRHFSEKNEKDKNEMICGVGLVANKLESLSTQIQQVEPIRTYNLKLNYSDFWQKFLEGFKNEKIASGYLNYSSNSIELETELKLELNTDCLINSIVVSHKDSHIFIADADERSIIEFTELGEKVCECLLIEGGKEFMPIEMFLTSSEILVVNCLWTGYLFVVGKKEKHVAEENIFLLKRTNVSPFLEIKKIIEKETKKFPDPYSVCKMKKTILIFDSYKLQIYFYTENGEYIKTIDTGESAEGGYVSLIRSDPSTGNFFGVKPDTCKICFFDENGRKLKTFETEEKISDFFINDFGDFYFCNEDGIFSFFPEKKLHEFQKEYQNRPKFPNIFVSNEKIFVSLMIDEEYFIKIFKILD